jgi:hypothetical protein
MSVKLTSPPYAGATLLLDHDVEEHDTRGGKRVARAGKKVVFSNHMAEVSDADWELVKQHPAYTGEGGHERWIMRWDEAVAVPQGLSRSGPQVVDGAIGAPTKSPIPPIPGWDEMTTRQVIDQTKGWTNVRIEQAIAWELAGRRRKMVVRPLTDALLDDAPDEPQPAAAPIAPSFSAPLPEGQDGL